MSAKSTDNSSAPDDSGANSHSMSHTISAPDDSNRIESTLSDFTKEIIKAKSTIEERIHEKEEEKKKKCVRLKKPMKSEESIVFDLDKREALKELVNLQKIFAERDPMDLGMEPDMFTDAIQTAMGTSLSAHEAQLLHLKVDSNCDGSVDWDEFLTYMCLEYIERAHMMQLSTKILPNQFEEIKLLLKVQRQHDSVRKILWVPHVLKFSRESSLTKTGDPMKGYYTTISMDGTLNVWSKTMKHVNRFSVVANKKPKGLSICVTDMLFMPNCNMFIITNTFAEMAFYEVIASQNVKTFEITDMGTMVTAMDYWYNPYNPNHALLAWGDTHGAIFIITFQQELFIPAIKKINMNSRCYADMVTEPLPGCHLTKRLKVHTDFVLKVIYSEPMRTIFSCCESKSDSVARFNLDTNIIQYICIPKGVTAFAVNNEGHVLITGGRDSFLRAWNLYNTKKPAMIMTGHGSPVSHLHIDKMHGHIISIDRGKDIFIWDLSSSICIQHIQSKFVDLGDRPITGFSYNPVYSALLLATNKLSICQFEHEDPASVCLRSHIAPQTHGLYNSLFDYVVVASNDSRITVYNHKTGTKVIHFIAHTTINQYHDIVEVEITAICFDETLRKLMTAARDGSMKIWNFNNGCLLDTVPKHDKEVTSIVMVKKRIYVTGWDRKVSIYQESQGEFKSKCWIIEHQDDIMTMGYMAPNIIVTGANDGEIVVWKDDTGSVLLKLNGNKSWRPISSGASRTSNEAKMRHIVGIWKKYVEEKQLNREMMSTTEFVCAVPPPTVPSKNILPIEKPTNVPAAQAEEPQQKSILTSSNRAHRERRSTRGKAQSISEEEEPKEGDWLAEFIACYAVYSIEFLETRESAPSIATLVTAGGEGWVRFWAIHQNGGMLGQFNSAHRKGEEITCMATDPLDIMLITGDTLGYIKIWNISTYAYTPENKYQCMDKWKKVLYMIRARQKFSFINLHKISREKAADQSKHVPPSPKTNPQFTHRLPELFNSFRAHLDTINSLQFIPNGDLIITCSTDCSTRLWTIDGLFVGIYGQTSMWKDPILSKLKYRQEQLVPADLKVGSSGTSLRILRGVDNKSWKKAKDILLPLMGHYSYCKNIGQERRASEAQDQVAEPAKTKSRKSVPGPPKRRESMLMEESESEVESSPSESKRGEYMDGLAVTALESRESLMTNASAFSMAPQKKRIIKQPCIPIRKILETMPLPKPWPTSRVDMLGNFTKRFEREIRQKVGVNTKLVGVESGRMGFLKPRSKSRSKSRTNKSIGGDSTASALNMDLSVFMSPSTMQKSESTFEVIGDNAEQFASPDQSMLDMRYPSLPSPSLDPETQPSWQTEKDVVTMREVDYDRAEFLPKNAYLLKDRKVTSDILGKSYKKTARGHEMPDMSLKPHHCPTGCFDRLPYHDFEAPKGPHISDTLQLIFDSVASKRRDYDPYSREGILKCPKSKRKNNTARFSLRSDQSGGDTPSKSSSSSSRVCVKCSISKQPLLPEIRLN